MKRSLSTDQLESTHQVDTQELKKTRVDTEVVLLPSEEENQDGLGDVATHENGTNTKNGYDESKNMTNGNGLEVNGFNHDLETSQVNGFTDRVNEVSHIESSGDNNTDLERLKSVQETEKIKESNPPAEVAQVEKQTDEPVMSVNEKDESDGASCSRSEGWDQQELSTWSLPGHMDIVTHVDMDAHTLVTASADTTLKAWNLDTRNGICSLGGHKGAVMSVRLLAKNASRELLTALGESEEVSGQIIISGSQDCYANVWLIPEGRLLRSIYTFNNVWQVDYLQEEKLVVTGTDSGKLEVFDIVTGSQIDAVQAFDNPMAALKISGGMIVCADTHAQIQLWKIKDQKLHCIKCTNSVGSVRCSLTGMSLQANGVITSHITGKLKSLSFLTESVRRVACPGKGKANDVCIEDELLVAVTSDADCSALHFYKMPRLKYLGSVENEGRTASVAAAKLDGSIDWRIVTGGSTVRLWETSLMKKRTEECEQPVRVTLWAQPEVTETDSEEEEEEETNQTKKNQLPAKNSPWGCQIL